MKKSVIVLLVMLVILPLASAGFLERIFGPDPRLGPSDTTDVQVGVGNAAPIVNVTRFEPSSLALNGGINTTINVTVSVTDYNGVGDLVSSTIYFMYNTSGGENVSGDNSVCVNWDVGSNTREYNCTINFTYFATSDPNWQFAFNISDGTDVGQNTTETIVVQPLDELLINGTPVDFASVAPGQPDVINDLPYTGIINNGNYEGGTVDVTATNLEETGAGTDIIPATAFTSAGSSEGDVCGSGNALSTSAVTITTSSIPKGPAGSNDDWLQWCMDVPSGIAVGTYTAVEGGGVWTISM
jgi:hypothetical protein